MTYIFILINRVCIITSKIMYDKHITTSYYSIITPYFYLLGEFIQKKLMSFKCIKFNRCKSIKAIINYLLTYICRYWRRSVKNLIYVINFIEMLYRRIFFFENGYAVNHKIMIHYFRKSDLLNLTKTCWL